MVVSADQEGGYMNDHEKTDHEKTMERMSLWTAAVVIILFFIGGWGLL
jgi:hypothetical protein